LLEKCIEEQKTPDNLGDFIKWLSEKEHVFGFVFQERWIDIGSKEQLEEVNILYSK
jgi:NDP-sugar pyrophosphorylase family protein